MSRFRPLPIKDMAGKAKIWRGQGNKFWIESDNRNASIRRTYLVQKLLA